MDIGIFKKLHAAQLKCRVKLFALILSYLEVATHYLPLHQIFIFQHTLTYPIYPPPCRFNTATRRWLVAALNQAQTAAQFQHAAARRRLGRYCFKCWGFVVVSTHSRPKAAGWRRAMRRCWRAKFQHTAARRRLVKSFTKDGIEYNVSTHSRPKAAGL